jgi:putative NADPH-quinone reductase
MLVSVILAHPDPASFNHALAQASVAVLERRHHQVHFHDLYAEVFPPVLPGPEIPQGAPLPDSVKRHCDELVAADGIVIIHPNWWGQPPAVLKGWIDRVMRPGVAYRFLEGDGGEGVPEGLLKARAAVVFNTSNTEVRREQKVFGDPLETIWRNCIFGLCGVHRFYRRTFGVLVTSSSADRKCWLAEAGNIIERYFP